MRKLATIQEIRDILPIPNADAIELALVNDWQVVVTKSAGHKIGEQIVYCEIDSFLPLEPEFEFLRKSSYKKFLGDEGFLLKTIRLRGQISQGLVIPMSHAVDIANRRGTKFELSSGTDVTNALGIRKFEPPISVELNGIAKGSFPSFIVKTDEERIQNLTSKYEWWRDGGIQNFKFYATEKLDGTSISVYLKDGMFGVCSRNLELERPTDISNTYWSTVFNLDIESKLKSLGKNICIQGEMIGEGIQKNKYKITGRTIYFFNVFDIDAHKRIEFPRCYEIISELGLNGVPIIDIDFKLPNKISDLIAMADGDSALTPNVNREGLVIRSHDGSVSFKAISNRVLLADD